jgi:hypothetical protein
MTRAVRSLAVWCGAAAAVALAGCGSAEKPGGVDISGRVMDGQTQIVPSGTEMLVVNLYMMRADGTLSDEAESAVMQEDGTYEAFVIPGTYKISVLWFDKYPGGTNKLEGRKHADLVVEGGGDYDIVVPPAG